MGVGRRRDISNFWYQEPPTNVVCDSYISGCMRSAYLNSVRKNDPPKRYEISSSGERDRGRLFSIERKEGGAPGRSPNWYMCYKEDTNVRFVSLHWKRKSHRKIYKIKQEEKNCK